ncbi:Com family DNA-binding transcriptional regulator [Neisseria leonii]
MLELRCPRCAKLLGRAAKNARIEIKCPRCSYLASFN